MKASELATLLNGKLVGNGNVLVSIPKPIEESEKNSTVFLLDEKFDIDIEVGLVVSKDMPGHIKSDAVILVENPKKAFIKTLELFYKPYDEALQDEFKIIGQGCEISKDAIIFPFVYIANNVKIKKGAVIHPFVYIQDGVEIGEDTIIHSHVFIGKNIKIGNNVIIHSGTVIGADGFGFERTDRGYIKIPQIGGVIIEDDVEIGANCTIDRSTIGNTVIKKGTKLDDQVHIAHNVKIGRHTVMAAQTGIAGSTKVGDWVMMGGQVGIKDHVEIKDNTIILAQSGITKNTEKGKIYVGSPAKEAKKAWKELAYLNKIEELFKRVAILEKKLEEKDHK